MYIAHARSLIALLGLAIVSTGCDDPTRPPGAGAIRVEVVAEGSDVQTTGYLSVVDNDSRLLDVPNLRTTFTNIPPGAHVVRLDGLAPNCTVVGQNPVTVEVTNDETVNVRFTVACVAYVGTVRVTTVTTGGELDPNGYVAMSEGMQLAAVGANTSAVIPGVRAGRQLIWIGDVASNCRVITPNPVDVNVPFQGTVEVTFTVQCVLSGALRVTIATTGVDVNHNGYVVTIGAPSVSFASSLTVPPNGSVTFASLRPAADYRVMLQALGANCDVVGAGVQTVSVSAGDTASVALDVACSPVPWLAFVRNGDIYVMPMHGSATRLTTDPALDANPAWSSDGRIAFMTGRYDNGSELYVMNADGTNPVRLTTSAGDDDMPSWSPSGQKIVFQSTRDGNHEIYVVNADGTGLTRLTTNTAADFQPAWSSTGKIAFISTRDHPAGEIYVMSDDGSNVVRLTNNAITESSPAWSPDGSMIVFARSVECIYYYYDYFCGQGLLVVNADGSNERGLATGDGPDLLNADPAWSPNGNAIAFTQMSCPLYCGLPSVMIVDPHGTAPTLFASNAANPAWKP
jgi:Tol biopolymer transport system component